MSRKLNISEVAPILPHEFFQEIGDRMYCTTLLSGAKGTLLPMLAYHKYLIVHVLIEMEREIERDRYQYKCI